MRHKMQLTEHERERGITKSQSFCSSAPFIPLAYFNDQEISGFKGALAAIKILELQSGSFMT